ncbi:MAG: M36 family metallopeptidase [Chitinophagales bacterium]|nr:M36 family metallopeptidase [Chitinophagales bacterium]
MRKVYFPTLMVLCFVALSFSSFGQEISKEQAIRLLNKNLSELNLTSQELQNAEVTSAYTDRISGVNLIYLQQYFQGIPVYNSVQVIAIKGDKVVNSTGSRIYGLEQDVAAQKAIPAIPAKDAVLLAAKSIKLPTDILAREPLTVLRQSPDGRNVKFSATEATRENITSELMWTPDENKNVHLSWQVKLTPKDDPDYWLVRVDANTGNILGTDNLTVYCDWDSPASFAHGRELTLSLTRNLATPLLPGAAKQTTDNTFAINSAQYKVIPYPAASMDHPGGALTAVSNPWTLAGSGNNATTLKWNSDGTTDYDYTRGNNVWAREDIAGSNGSGLSATSTTPLPDLTFNYTFNPNINPGGGDNLKVGITNLFYWNNIMHDLTYQYGFDEVSGNFQMNNLGRGGAGNDAVNADAQDGSGRNNANFATPSDGSSPRMQMFLFDGSPYSGMKINSPISANVFSIEGAISINNLLANVGPVTGNLALYNDDLSGSTHLACGPPAIPAEINGKIAVIDRGSCAFTDKVKNAQNAGAIAVIVINTDDTGIKMSGDDNSITIPAVAILNTDGNTLKALMATYTLNVTLKATLDLDGDLDNSVIAHEYTHGVSNRLTGGPAAATCLQNKEQMGEGWSDYYALMATTDWATASVTDGNIPRPIGTYVMGEDPADGYGIRSYRYSTDMNENPLTYAALSPAYDGSPHMVGEVWATALWHMTWNIIEQDNKINTNFFDANGEGGNTAAMKLVTLAMKLQPCSPGFLDGRDAILKADEILYNGKYRCAIWDAFALRGMGVNAKQGSSNNLGDQVADYTVPKGALITKKVNKVIAPQNDILTYTFTIKAQCEPITGYKITDTLQGNVTYISGGTYNNGNRTVTFNVPSLAPEESTTLTLTVRVNTGTYFLESNLFSESVPLVSLPPSFNATTNDGTKNWGTSPIANSAPYAMKSATSSTPAEQVLTSTDPIAVADHVQLSFYHQFSTENGRDGGVVELSLDGSTWFDAGPYMAENGYNGKIIAGTSLDGKPAFTGSKTSYFRTTINLSAFQGQSVYYRFRYVTDQGGSSLGWYIDDILVKKMPAVYNIAGVRDGADNLYALSDTITAITSGTIPVVWSDFTVQKDGGRALLKWETQQESNTDKYIIERSGDGVNFLAIGTQAAAGNSSTPRKYSFYDESPLTGNNIYRIQLLDKDGKVSYSKALSLYFNEPAGMVVALTPNPARSIVELTIQGNSTPLRVDLVDAAGRTLRTYDMKTEKIRIPVATLTQGVYYLKIKGDRLDTTRKFIKE